MSEDVKNFGLIGVGSTIQLGKRGSKLKNDAGVIQVRNAADAAFARIQAADPSVPDDLVTLRHLNSLSGININDGMDVPLGVPTDGSLAGGAVPLGSSDTVTDAIDGLNEVLGKLVPTQPPNFPNGQALTVSSVGNSPVLASGSVPDNTAGGTVPATAGQSVTRINAASFTTNTISTTGPGDSGTVTALVNAASVGSRAMSTGPGADNGLYGKLRIANDASYPSGTPGFWESFDARIEGGVATQGWNRAKLTHSAAGSTNDVYFVYDNLDTAPTMSGGAVAQNAQGTLAYSSGVPHYGSGATLTVSGLSMTNLAGETYYNGNPVAVAGSNSIINSQSFTYANCGIATPVARQTTTAQALSNLTVSVNGSTFNQGTLSVSGTNVKGTGSAVTISSPVILVKSSTTGRFDELSIPVNGLGSSPVSTAASRIAMITGDTPAATFTGTATDWNASTAINAWDAAVVAGVLKNDVTNYSVGYLPAGPDYSGHAASQYVTIWFRRTPVSKFDIKLTGTVAGCWVKLVGVSDTFSSANGWWSMGTAYAGAGTPGDTGGGNGSNGCALGGTMPFGSAISGTQYTATFGQASSSTATNNSILVRFKLNAGQSISSLSFEVATH